ncbi:lipase 3-like isoform X2 [Oratosquilla oratoria]
MTLSRVVTKVTLVLLMFLSCDPVMSCAPFRARPSDPLTQSFAEGFRRGLATPALSSSPEGSALRTRDPSATTSSKFAFPTQLLRNVGLHDKVVSKIKGRHLGLQSPGRVHPDVYRSTPELISSNGYPVETHHAVTKDGYILELHRIPHGKRHSGYRSGAKMTSRPAVLLMHCLLCSSSIWILNLPGKSLAYQLADAGYDVWMPNLRGNTYSRTHIKYTENDEKYWDFSWQEMANYDVPKSIDFILEITGQKDLYYIGFSMGTTVFYATMSEHPEYNQKVRLMVSLAPVAYVANAQGPVETLGNYVYEIEALLTNLQIYEFFPRDSLSVANADLCRATTLTAPICYSFLDFLGAELQSINTDYLAVILSHYPAGSSVRAVSHFGQNLISGQFAKYDYGVSGNLAHYGSTTPPKYDLYKVTTPVALIWSEGDWLATPKDVARLSRELPNVVSNERVADKKFTHNDFMWGIHADELVYHQVLRLLSQF